MLDAVAGVRAGAGVLTATVVSYDTQGADIGCK